MKHFNKRTLAQAVTEAVSGAALRAPRRKPVFEPLEPRVLLSGELPVVPPQPDHEPAVLSAPLEFGKQAEQLLIASLSEQFQPVQGRQPLRFADGWGVAELTPDSSGQGLTLDFSAVHAKLVFEIAADGSVNVSDASGNRAHAGRVARLVGGAGDDVFRFAGLPAALEIAAGQGSDTLDFSALQQDLICTTHADGSLSITSTGDAAAAIHVTGPVSLLQGQGRNAFIEEHAPMIAGAIGAGGGFSAALSRLSLAAFVATQPAPREIVFVDASIENYQGLLADLFPAPPDLAPDSPDSSMAGAPPASAPAAPGRLLVITLDPGWDGVEQISQALAAFQGLAAVHVLSHGSSGSLRLGSRSLDDERLDAIADQLRGWRRALAPGADLLLYGCNVAEGEAGLNFVSRLADRVGADVAASHDPTGAAALGGDWQLEAHTGVIEVQALAWAGWQGLLAAMEGEAGRDTFTISKTEVARIGLAAALKFAAAEDVRVDGKEGDDLFNLRELDPARAGDITLDGNTGNDTVSLSNIAAPMTIQLTSTAGGATVEIGGFDLSLTGIETVIAGSGINTLDLSVLSAHLMIKIVGPGKVDLAILVDGEPPRHFATIDNIANVVGGRGRNVFVFGMGGSLSGTLDGHSSAGNVLSYSSKFSAGGKDYDAGLSAYKQDVRIELKPGSATAGEAGGLKTGPAGGFSNIRFFVGGGERAALTAGDAGSSLTGGAGQDRFTAGAGADALVGGKGDDSFVFETAEQWKNDTITEAAGEGHDTLDLASLTTELSVEVQSFADAGIKLISAGQALRGVKHVETLRGGTGKSSYKFYDNWGAAAAPGQAGLTIDDSRNDALGTVADQGTLDFSAVTMDLVFTLASGGAVTVEALSAAGAPTRYTLTATGIANLIGGQGNNTFRINHRDALAGTISQAPNQAAGKRNILDYSGMDPDEPVAVDLARGIATGVGDKLADVADEEEETQELFAADLGLLKSFTLSLAGLSSAPILIKTVPAETAANIAAALQALLNAGPAQGQQGAGWAAVTVTGAGLATDPWKLGFSIPANLPLLSALGEGSVVTVRPGTDGQPGGPRLAVSGITGTTLDGTSPAGQVLVRNAAGGRVMQLGSQSGAAQGQAGDDKLSGGLGDDDLHGGAGTDTLIEVGGNNVLYGDAGNDSFTVEGGTNRLYGGAGDDSFVLRDHWGQASIFEGVKAGLDTIDLSDVSSKVSYQFNQGVLVASTAAFRPTQYSWNLGQIASGDAAGSFAAGGDTLTVPLQTRGKPVFELSHAGGSGVTLSFGSETVVVTYDDAKLSRSVAIKTALEKQFAGLKATVTADARAADKYRIEITTPSAGFMRAIKGLLQLQPDARTLGAGAVATLVALNTGGALNEIQQLSLASVPGWIKLAIGDSVTAEIQLPAGESDAAVANRLETALDQLQQKTGLSGFFARAKYNVDVVVTGARTFQIIFNAPAGANVEEMRVLDPSDSSDPDSDKGKPIRGVVETLREGSASSALANIDTLVAANADNEMIFGNGWGTVYNAAEALLPETWREPDSTLTIDTRLASENKHQLILDFSAVSTELKFNFTTSSYSQQLIDLGLQSSGSFGLSYIDSDVYDLDLKDHSAGGFQLSLNPPDGGGRLTTADIEIDADAEITAYNIAQALKKAMPGLLSAYSDDVRVSSDENDPGVFRIMFATKGFEAGLQLASTGTPLPLVAGDLKQIARAVNNVTVAIGANDAITGENIKAALAQARYADGTPLDVKVSAGPSAHSWQIGFDKSDGADLGVKVAKDDTARSWKVNVDKSDADGASDEIQLLRFYGGADAAQSLTPTDSRAGIRSLAALSVTSLEVVKVGRHDSLPLDGIGADLFDALLTTYNEYNKLVFTHVDENTTIYGGGNANTFALSTDASFAGTLIGGTGLRPLSSVAANSFSALMGLQLPELTVINTVDISGAQFDEGFANLADSLKALKSTEVNLGDAPSTLMKVWTTQEGSRGDAVQQLILPTGADAGSFKLSYADSTMTQRISTAAIRVEDRAALTQLNIETALEAIPGVGTVSVMGEGSLASPFLIRFVGSGAKSVQPLQVAELALLRQVADAAAQGGTWQIDVFELSDTTRLSLGKQANAQLSATGMRLLLADSAGSFTVSDGSQTLNLGGSMGAAALQQALEGLASIGAGHVQLGGSRGAGWTITLTNPVAATVLRADSGDAPVLRSIRTLDLAATGTHDDILLAGEGRNVLLGGLGADTLTAGAGHDFVFGDNGAAAWDRDRLLTAWASSEPALGGDTVTTGRGRDIVLGDLGFIQLNAAGTHTLQIAARLFDQGGNDSLALGDGSMTVIGGFGADTISTGTGANLILGDNGQLDFSSAGALLLMQSLDALNATTGADTLTLGDGINIVIAGLRADRIRSGSGADLVLGDNGRIEWDAQGRVRRMIVTETPLGGDDDMHSGNGDNTLIGGTGRDHITTGEGTDVILGDNGELRWFASQTWLAQARSLDAIEGGDDTMALGDGFKTVIGGFGADVIAAGAGRHIVAGDNAQIEYNAAGLATLYATTDAAAATGDADTILLADGDNIILGGLGGDSITTGAGQDTVLGDDGFIQLNAAGTQFVEIVSRVGPGAAGAGAKTAQARGTALSGQDPGGDDQLQLGDGAKLVIAGFGHDSLRAGNGRHTVFGDNGRVDFNGEGLAFSCLSTDADDSSGGSDSITLGDGDSLVIGGLFGDSVSSGRGAGIVLGDNGRVLMNAAGTLLALIESLDPGRGGDDRITTGTGRDLVFGDNARISFIRGVAVRLVGTDTSAATAGDDVIALGDGDKRVIAGAGSDQVSTGAGSDIVLGDGGEILFGEDGALLFIATGDPLLGGGDVISLGDGNDFAAGGAGNDRIAGMGGADVLFGDFGWFSFSDAGTRLTLLSVDMTLGGDDDLDGGDGSDIIIAGAGNDVMHGDRARDLLLGGNASIRLRGGIAEQVDSELSPPGSRSRDSASIASRMAPGASAGSAFDRLHSDVAAGPAIPAALLGPSVFQRFFASDLAGAAAGELASLDGPPPVAAPGEPLEAEEELQEGLPAGPRQVRLPAPLPQAPLAPAAEMPAQAARNDEAGDAGGLVADSAAVLAGLGLFALLDREAMQGTKGRRDRRPALSRQALENVASQWFAAAPAGSDVSERKQGTPQGVRPGHVLGTREEIMLLFGANQAWQGGQKDVTVLLSERIVLNPYAAKRLLVLLGQGIKEYESRYGELKV